MTSPHPRNPVPDFQRLFRPQSFRFELGIRSAAASWFQLSDSDSLELEARRAVVAAHPARHSPWEPAADPVLDAMLGLFAGKRTDSLKAGGVHSARTLAGFWEPDFVLLQRDSIGDFRMVGGCVCDPSAWDPAAKLGCTLAEIHSPVPTLNARLGGHIQAFLDGLPAEVERWRENWGLAAVPDRNLHPALGLPRLGRDADLREVWLRVEHQAFRALPAVQGIVFLIRLTVHPLADVIGDPRVRASLHQLLGSMPDSIAEYKGLIEARPALMSQLAG